MTAILRAGPFASLSAGQLPESFVNEPDVFNSNVFPVNCANITSSLAWPWRYNKSIGKTLITHTGCATDPGSGEQFPTTSTSTSSDGLVKTATEDFSISDSASSNHELRINVSLGFAYQATQSFDVKVTFNISASGDSTLTQQGTMGFLDTFNSGTGPIEGFPSVSGSVTRTIPPSYVPNFYIAEIFSDGASIDFPSDICIPNTSSVSVSGSLAFEFL
tara:strand:- start:76 stop:729 length:654 start_codon:yes stop_codon:yes gene_type:complete